MEGMNNLPTYCFFQPMMPPYGPPYAAFYSPGGVYTHPAVAIVSVLSMCLVVTIYIYYFQSMD